MMVNRKKLGLGAALCLVVAAFAAAAESAEDPISKLGWLAGCWESTGNGPRIDEQWMKPLGGLMLGISRTVKGGSANQFEQMRIQQLEGALIFTSKPSGQQEASFTSIEVSSTHVVFENKAHDFPHRIIYRLGDDGSLAARIEGERGGKVNGVDFPMRRTECGLAGR